MKNKFVMWR